MIEVRYELLDDNCFINYLTFLKDKLYKSLCLKEEESNTLFEYMSSLQRELIGSKELIVFLKNDARFISLLSKVQYLISEPNTSHKVFKQEIFSSISIVEKLIDKYKVGD
jgi:hypothetical protein